MSDAPFQPRRSDPWVVWLATGLGIGRRLPAPGTWGSLWGLPLAWLILHLPFWWMQVITIVALFAVGVPLCDRAARVLGVKDPGMVVWDELITVPIVFLGLSPQMVLHPVIALIGFGLHRLIDITKPAPCRQLERLRGGWGIMADDVVAGIYGWVALQLLLRLVPSIVT